MPASTCHLRLSAHLSLGYTLLGCVLACPAGILSAAQINRAGNTLTLENNLAWSGALLPQASDVAVFGSDVSSTNHVFSANLSWSGLVFASNLSGRMQISSTSSSHALQLGSQGLDALANNADVQMACRLQLAGLQDWRVAAGRTVFLGSNGSNALLGGDGVLRLMGGGALDCGQSSFSGYAGKWEVHEGSSLYGVGNDANAWGSNVSADAILLAGGRLIAGGRSTATRNYAWNSNIMLQAGTQSVIGMKYASGANRYLLLKGVIGGSGDLVFSNLSASGVASNSNYAFILSANNSFSGNMYINSGTSVRIGGQIGTSSSASAGNSGSLSDGVVVYNSGVLRLSKNNAWNFNNVVSGSGILAIGTNVGTTSSQRVTTSVVHSYSGDTQIYNGWLIFGGAGQLGSGNYAGNISNNGVLRFAGSANQQLSGVISGTGRIELAGGQLDLNSASNFSGGVRVSGGNLRAGHASALGTGLLSITGGTVNFYNHAISNSVQLNSGSLFAGSGNSSNVSLGGNARMSGSFASLSCGSSATRTLNVTGGLQVGTLQGQGRLQGGLVQVSSLLQPGGNASGLLQFNAGLQTLSSSVLEFQIAGLSRGSQYDALNVSAGNLVLSGVLKLGSAASFNFSSLQAGNSFNLVNFSSGGSFSSSQLQFDFSAAGLGSGLAWDTSLFGTSGTLRVVDAASIPEPAASLLALPAVLLLILPRKRRALGRGAC